MLFLREPEAGQKLIAGPGVYICDECIELCNEIIEEELQESSELQLGIFHGRGLMGRWAWAGRHCRRGRTWAGSIWARSVGRHSPPEFWD